MNFVFIYKNTRMKSVEIALRRGEWGMKEDGGGESN
jgi:hypothetical protein